MAFFAQRNHFLASKSKSSFWIDRVACHLVSKHHYEDENVRETVIQHSFPLIFQIASTNLHHGSWEVVKMTFKIFLNAFAFSLPEFDQAQSFLAPWMELFMQALLVPCPLEFQLDEAEDSEREKSFFWKMKKWACHCINKLFCRYVASSEQYTSVKTTSGFKKTFISSHAVSSLKKLGS